MVKNLRYRTGKIGQQRGKFPWCTGYLPKWHSQELDILINRNPDDYRPHMLLPIFLFDIKANMHNWHLVRINMIKVEIVEGISLEQYVTPKSKAAYIKSLKNAYYTTSSGKI